jgi:hypothetical protein
LLLCVCAVKREKDSKKKDKEEEKSRKMREKKNWRTKKCNACACI